MPRRKMWSLYRKWFVLSVLAGCLYGFGGSENSIRSVTAAPCVQECESNQGSCRSNCETECLATSTQAECNSCILSCNSQFLSCMQHAVWCENEETQPGRCMVNWGLNCPYDPATGGYTCDPNQGAQNGYSLTCSTLGGGTCVACPDFRYCTGAGGGTPCV